MMNTKPQLRLLHAEVTETCNLACVHCYAGSSPYKSHGVLSGNDWKSIIEQASSIGVKTFQFIGGEPTARNDLAELIEFANEQSGIECVEVYSNLYRITPRLWEVFQNGNTSLATSFYAINAKVHDSVTARLGSQERTLANIKKAIGLNIPVRAGVIEVVENQDIDETRRFLEGLGIYHVGVDRKRGIGRGKQLGTKSTIDELCGSCANNVATVRPDGSVSLCIMTRDPDMAMGNVLNQSLSTIVNGSEFKGLQQQLRETFNNRIMARCGPDDRCEPKMCGPSCNPREPCDPVTRACEPNECPPDRACPPD